MDLDKTKKQLADTLENVADWVDRFCVEFGLIEDVEEGSPPGIFVGDCVEIKDDPNHDLYLVLDIVQTDDKNHASLVSNCIGGHRYIRLDQLILRASRSKNG